MWIRVDRNEKNDFFNTLFMSLMILKNRPIQAPNNQKLHFAWWYTYIRKRPPFMNINYNAKKRSWCSKQCTVFELRAFLLTYIYRMLHIFVQTHILYRYYILSVRVLSLGCGNKYLYRNGIITLNFQHFWVVPV